MDLFDAFQFDAEKRHANEPVLSKKDEEQGSSRNVLTSTGAETTSADFPRVAANPTWLRREKETTNEKFENMSDKAKGKLNIKDSMQKKPNQTSGSAKKEASKLTPIETKHKDQEKMKEEDSNVPFPYTDSRLTSQPKEEGTQVGETSNPWKESVEKRDAVAKGNKVVSSVSPDQPPDYSMDHSADFVDGGAMKSLGSSIAGAMGSVIHKVENIAATVRRHSIDSLARKNKGDASSTMESAAQKTEDTSEKDRDNADVTLAELPIV